MLRIVDLRAPGMQFQRVHLHQLEQAGGILDVDVVLGAALLLQRNRLDMRAQVAAFVLLEEAVATGAIGAAQQRQGAACDLASTSGATAR